MKSLYLDCFSGLSGDMFLSGLVDLGLPPSALQRGLRKLGIGRFEMRFGSVDQKAIRARRLHLSFADAHHHARHDGHGDREYADIARQVRRSGLPPRVIERALAVFEVVAKAEAKVHGVKPERVHFHELGALDSIVDIVGAALGIEILGIEKIFVSPLPLGRGFVDTAHGRFPVPAPATLEILKRFPIRDWPEAHEMTTPTGAAIAVALGEPVDTFPQMSIAKIGYGSGSRQGVIIPNVVRMVLGESLSNRAGEGVEWDSVWVMETNVDDMSPEIWPRVVERLFAVGALDVQLLGTHMKLGRPGFLLKVIVPLNRRDTIGKVLFEETPTIGVRFHRVDRMKLSRRTVKIRTAAGDVRVKISSRNGRILTAKPEVSDATKMAERTGRPLREVLAGIHQRVARDVLKG